MAHQTDVHIVKEKFRSENPTEQVLDPICGMKIERRTSRHVVFRPERTYYFCSRNCAQRFMDPKLNSKLKKQAA